MSDSKRALVKIQELLPMLEERDKKLLLALLMQQGVFADTRDPVTATGRKDEAIVDVFYEALKVVLSRNSISVKVPLHVLHARDRKAIKESSEVLVTLLKDNGLFNTNNLTKLSLLTASAVAVHLKRIRVPLSLRSLAEAGPRYVGILDNEYPGYIDSGLLGALLFPVSVPSDG